MPKIEGRDAFCVFRFSVMLGILFIGLCKVLSSRLNAMAKLFDGLKLLILKLGEKIVS